MASFSSLTLTAATALLLLLPFSLAQTTQIVTWSAVTLVYHGEKTPFLSNVTSYDLTPLGANQLYSAGQTLRSRYIDGNTASVINGMTTGAIDNSQIYILSTDDAFLSASAMACMQGMYPPFFEVNEESILANGSQLTYPLGGYQYPAINAVSELDYNYLWIAGNIGCDQYAVSEVESLISAAYTAEMEAHANFYESLNDTVFRDIEPDLVNYGNAYDLYEYALYESNHNTTLFNRTSFTQSDLAQLEVLASQQQWEFNTPANGSSIGAIAGQTLASKVLQQFSHNIASAGVTDKMTLMFSSFEPFLSFFALSNLATGPSASRFNSLPQHGSILTFELYSYQIESANENTTAAFPNPEDLWVNFYYSNGTNTEGFINYSLFGRGNSEAAMTWNDFVEGLGSFALNDITDWCTQCGAVTLFCEGLESSLLSPNCSSTTTSASADSKGLSPAIAGVIGAIVTLATFVLIGAVLMLVGFRLNHRERKETTLSNAGDLGVLKRSGSGANGGFKGAEKLASDTDLRLKNGAGASVIRHERVGSWELNESPVSPTDHSSLDKEIESGRVVSTADYSRHSEDHGLENPFGDPVKPLDQV